MADAKVSALNALTTPVAADLTYAVLASGPTEKKMTMATLQAFALAPFGGGTEVSVSTSTALTINRMHVISGSSAITPTLPAVSGNTGNFIGIRITNTNFVTIDGNASETIDGALTRVMWLGESALLLCDGSNWFKVAGKSLPMICSMWQTGAQNIPSAGSGAILLLDSTSLDNTALMANTSTHKITCKRSGTYIAMASVTVGPAVTARIDRLQMFVESNDGGTPLAGTILLNAINAGAELPQYASAAGLKNIPLTAGDYINLIGYQVTTGATAQPLYAAEYATYLNICEVPNW